MYLVLLKKKYICCIIFYYPYFGSKIFFISNTDLNLAVSKEGPRAESRWTMGRCGRYNCTEIPSAYRFTLDHCDHRYFHIFCT